MSDRIHDDEPDTSEATVRALLAAECPDWSSSPLSYLQTSGTDNAMWRVEVTDGDDVVVRLPRRPLAAANVGAEVALLQRLETTALANTVQTPRVRHAGRPQDEFPHDWSVLGWLDGDDAWTARRSVDGSSRTLALDVAAAVAVIGALTDLPVEPRAVGERGGPIAPVVERLAWWLSDPRWNAPAVIDVPAVQRLAAEAADVVDEPVESRFVHGDLIPGNLLLDGGRLAAIIDWGSAGCGDPAQDLAPAWALFDGRARQVFREAVDADDATWLRARAIELEHAVGGVLYYGPRRHPLGDVMARTLDRILADR